MVLARLRENGNLTPFREFLFMHNAIRVIVALAVICLVGCAAEENLLDSYTQKREQSADDLPQVAQPATDEAPQSEDSSSAGAAVSAAVAGDIAAPISDQAFREAALAGDGPTVMKGLQDGVDVNSPDENGRTALMLAAYDGHTEIVKLLLQRKAQVNRRDATDRTALMYASSGKNPETVRVLLDAGANVGIVDNQENWTALMFAAAEGNVEVVKQLLASGADPTRADVDGETSVEFAVDNGHMHVVNLLKEAIAERASQKTPQSEREAK